MERGRRLSSGTSRKTAFPAFMSEAVLLLAEYAIPSKKREGVLGLVTLRQKAPPYPLGAEHSLHTPPTIDNTPAPVRVKLMAAPEPGVREH